MYELCDSRKRDVTFQQVIEGEEKGKGKAFP
jgi:hypothetical protein